jgi:hypothetical protein
MPHLSSLLNMTRTVIDQHHRRVNATISVSRLRELPIPGQERACRWGDVIGATLARRRTALARRRTGVAPGRRWPWL